ncbi:Hydroxymethylglutaryl-CoA lyase YngG [Methylobacterium crusticola]|uniref:Hydroxymethylglutaryl-CoA lyase YngG n=1 Tax=Methylobacterium crusticola TaxID=1697972 RepID=A0ABQ4R3Y9_9HYPH|nr:hydroxymethylglutaryl-CoA lyase [Methylobacterium crusticola]GJD52169.1 Hydroxymethylglutaryl-CoA lyase YngG [Methylobacterium crusticola]
MTDHATIYEVGPRDGLQMAKATMPTATKLRWIDAMAAAGVAHMEVGSFVSPRHVPQMADTADVVGHTVAIAGLETIALVPNETGARLAYAAGCRSLVIPVSVSETHSRSNINKGTYEQVAEVARLVAWLRAQDEPVLVETACATAFGCSFEGAVPERRVVEVATALLQAGADRVSLADTVGYAAPNAIRSLVRATRAAAGGAFQKLHLHDTMGLGLANVLAGLDVDVRHFDASLAGLGGCPFAPGASGNIVTEDLVFLLESMGLRTGIDLEALVATRAFLREGLAGEPLHGSVGRAGIPRTFRAAA